MGAVDSRPTYIGPSGSLRFSKQILQVQSLAEKVSRMRLETQLCAYHGSRPLLSISCMEPKGVIVLTWAAAFLSYVHFIFGFLIFFLDFIY